MRTKLVLLALLVSFAALAFLVGTANANSMPNVDTVVTPATLPGSAYPWVQPDFRIVHGIVVATLPQTIVSTASTQPPAWVFSG